jgi:hypothetical protein
MTSEIYHFPLTSFQSVRVLLLKKEENLSISKIGLKMPENVNARTFAFLSVKI